MDVSVYSPGADAAAAAAVGAELAASPAALFASCTHVALQCALTDETRGLVDLELIRSMPGTGPRVLVNVARGGVAVEADVAAALANGDLDAYATDVFDDEPGCRDSSPLFRGGAPGVFATPHVGAATREAQDGVARLVADRVMDALDAI
jgi:phosphoglycerate dehydrogenase-like enzyme